MYDIEPLPDYLHDLRSQDEVTERLPTRTDWDALYDEIQHRSFRKSAWILGGCAALLLLLMIGLIMLLA